MNLSFSLIWANYYHCIDGIIKGSKQPVPNRILTQLIIFLFSNRRASCARTTNFKWLRPTHSKLIFHKLKYSTTLQKSEDYTQWNFPVKRIKFFYILYIAPVELWIFSLVSLEKKTPQNNFSNQNFSVENNYCWHQTLTQ